jgi:hypothetical protein
MVTADQQLPNQRVDMVTADQQLPNQRVDIVTADQLRQAEG